MRIVKFLIVLLLILNGCGGGSSGTGTGSTVVNGIVKSASDMPVSGALITILNNGASTRTDARGAFTIESNTIEEMQIQLEIEVGDQVDVVEINNATEEGARIEVAVKLGDQSSDIEVAEEVSATAKVVGYCDFAFENRPTIRQSNRLPNNTECTLKVTVAADGIPLAEAPFVLQARPCAGRNPWETVAVGETRPNGVGQVQFLFFNTIERCDYRAVVPYRLEGVKGVVFPLHTFGKQAFDREQIKQGN